MSKRQRSKKNGKPPESKPDTAVVVAWLTLVGVVISAVLVFAGVVLVPLIQKTPPPPTEIPTKTSTFTPIPPTPTVGPSPTPVPDFNIYTDADTKNHFYPTGSMGDVDDIKINEASSDNPHSGASAVKIVYDARGQGKNHICSMGIKSEVICKWAGVYWQNPADNWGDVPNAGFDLEGFRKLTFCARADTNSSGAQIKFLVGGIGWGVPTPPPYPDSLRPPRDSGLKKLTDQWQCFEIGLSDANLSYVIGGFAWVADWGDNEISEDNPKRIVFYLDDIRFER